LIKAASNALSIGVLKTQQSSAFANEQCVVYLQDNSFHVKVFAWWNRK
jgi:hypothetical protein